MFFREEDSTGASPGPEELDRSTSVLSRLQQTLHSLLTAYRSNQKEAKSWLLNAIASLDLQNPGLKRRKFAQFLPGGSLFDKGQHEEFGRQLLLGLFADEPRKVSQLIARDPGVLRQFFRTDPAHARLWFSHFSMAGMAEFKHGAAALAAYALRNRDEVWRLLVWGGKHPQAPVAVAQKPHYFCELDVPATIAALLDECPGFWESAELRESLKEGHVLAAAPAFWAAELYGWLQEFSSRSDRLFELVCDYVERGASWRQLCGRLLHLLPPPDLLRFATGLLLGAQPADPAAQQQQQRQQQQQQERGSAASAAGALPGGAWLVFGGDFQWGSVEELAEAAAVGCSLRQLGRMLREEENEAELQELLGLSEQLAQCETPAAHWHLRRQLATLEQQLERHRQQQQQQQAASAGESFAVAAASAPAAAAAAGTGKDSPTGLGIRSFLLLHLLAAYLRLQHLASALPRSGSSSTAAQQFCSLVQQAGLPCQPAGPQGGAAGRAAAGRDAGQEVPLAEAGSGAKGEDSQREQWRERRQKQRECKSERSGKEKKKAQRKEERRRSREGGRKRRRSEREEEPKKRQRRKRRRRSGGSSGSDGSSSDGSSGQSSSGGSRRGGRLGRGLDWSEELGSLGAATRDLEGLSGGRGSPGFWVQGLGEEAMPTLAAQEVVDLAVERLAQAYAAWLFR